MIHRRILILSLLHLALPLALFSCDDWKAKKSESEPSIEKPAPIPWTSYVLEISDSGGPLPGTPEIVVHKGPKSQIFAQGDSKIIIYTSAPAEEQVFEVSYGQNYQTMKMTVLPGGCPDPISAIQVWGVNSQISSSLCPEDPAVLNFKSPKGVLNVRLKYF